MISLMAPSLPRAAQREKVGAAASPGAALTHRDRCAGHLIGRTRTRLESAVLQSGPPAHSSAVNTSARSRPANCSHSHSGFPAHAIASIRRISRIGPIGLIVWLRGGPAALAGRIVSDIPRTAHRGSFPCGRCAGPSVSRRTGSQEAGDRRPRPALAHAVYALARQRCAAASRSL